VDELADGDERQDCLANGQLGQSKGGNRDDEDLS